ncbi:MAG: fimbrillin family protein [Bacteroidetes bacterium]|nr:fimbrillin family protein [Bacteroidota bacterium]
MKKKLLFAYLAAVVTLSSCSNDATISVNQNLTKIDFDAYTNSSTKATIVSMNNFNDFVVYGYVTPKSYVGKTDLGSPYMDALVVSREDSNVPWIYEGEYYWPQDDSKIQLFGISPKNDLVSEYITSKDSYPSFKYIIGDVGKNQKDLIVSSLLDQVETETVKTLKLNFKHILSQINFSVKGEVAGLEYNVTKIELINIKNEGKFTFDTPLKIGNWSDVKGTATYVHNLENFVVDGVSLKPLEGEDRTMILMPQENTENAKIKVTYSIRDNGGKSLIFDGSKEVDLSSFVWAINTKTRYTLTLPVTADKIIFITTIDKWVDETVPIVIK